jgi:hypothetical protein
MQLCCVYDIVLHERFRFRREDELAAARTRISEADKKVRSITKSVSEHPNMVALAKRNSELDSEEKVVRFGMSADALAHSYSDDADKRHNGLNAFEQAQLKLESIDIERNELSGTISSMMDHLNREFSFREAVDDVRSADQSYKAISQQNPADRPFYRIVESGIDVARLLPPAGFAIWALAILMVSMPNLSKSSPSVIQKASIKATASRGKPTQPPHAPAGQ